MRLERNEKPPARKAKRYEWQPWRLTLLGSLPRQAEKEQFWELICTRKGEALNILKAHLVDETAIATQTNSPLSQAKSTKAKTQFHELAVIMITGRTPEITVKFNERPDIPEQGKKVILLVKEENGVVVKAEMNRKTLKKQVEKMDSFADWVAALSGKIASVSPEGVIELEAAGVNVFEKKQKVAPPSESTENQTTPEQTAFNQATSTPDPEPEPEPPLPTKKTFRLVK